MANKKITQMTELGATPASDDKVPLVDVDDTTGSVDVTTKWVSVDNLISEVAVSDMTASAVVTESEGIGSSDNDTSFPTSAAVKDYVDTNVTAQDLDFQGDSGGALAIDLDSETLTVAGGTGIDTVGSSNTVTASIDSTVATLTGTQELTNKTLTDAEANTQPALDASTALATTAYADAAVAAAAGDITGVTAGAGLTGGGASGDVTVTVGAGTGITVNADDVALTNSAVTVGSTSISLGATATTIAGLSSVTSTAFAGGLTGDVTGDVKAADGAVAFDSGATVALSSLGDGVFATTQSASDNSTKVATTAYVDAQVGTSDTLSEVLDNGGTAISSALAGVISDETGSGALVFATSPTLVTPALGTPISGVATNLTGTAANLTAGTVTTNANLTGDVTSSGNATTYNGTLGVAKGGTNITSYTVGDILYADTTTTLAKLAASTDGYLLTATGAGSAPAWEAAPAASVDIGSSIPSGTSGSILFVDSSTQLAQDNSNFFWDDSNNRLGIGTTAPANTLHVQKDVDDFVAKIENDGNSTSSNGLWLDTRWNTGTNTVLKVTSNSGTADLFYIKGDGLVGIGAAAPTAKLDVLLGDDEVVRYKSAAQTLFEFWKEGSTEEARLNIKHGGALKIHLRGNGDSYFNGGNVGIGTTSPNGALHVEDLTGTNVTQFIAGTGSAIDLAFGDPDDDNIGIIKYNNAGDYMSFRTNNSEQVRIDSSGNVGIGISSSIATKLQVALGHIAIDNLMAYQSFTAGGTRRNLLSVDDDDTITIGDAPDFGEITILDSGNVGIGTPAPDFALDVAGDIGVDTHIYHNGDHNTFMHFGADTWKVRTGGTDRLYVGSSGNGNVGIGTTGSGNRLAVELADANTGIASGYSQLELTNTNATVGNYSRIFFNDTVGGGVSAIIGAKTVDHDNNYGDLEFWTRGAADAATRMTIDNTGRVTVKKSSNGEVDVLTSSVSITPDFDASNDFSLTLDHDTTLENPGTPDPVPGQSGCIVITQGSTGGTMTYGTEWLFEAQTAPTLSTTTGYVDNLVYYVAAVDKIHAVLLKDFG